MKRALPVIALILTSLAVSAPAFADRDSVEVFGKTFCTSQAPPDAQCDVRLGASPNARHALGMTICTGPVPTGIECDIDFSGAHREQAVAETKPWVLPMFGQTLCFGDVPATTQCDVRVGGGHHTAVLEKSTSKSSDHM